MIQINDLEIGTGMPKICAPIVENNLQKIREKVKETPKDIVDIVEWRVDYFDDVFDVERVVSAAAEIKKILGKTPLLFTFRTKKEGGIREISFDTYKDLLIAVAQSGNVDLVDVEVFRGYDKRVHEKNDWRITDACNESLRDLIEELKNHVKIIGSYHDFYKTPSREEILKRLLFMDRIGVDIPKMAVMPKEREDVICMMEATSLADRLIVEKPIITMAMGGLGAVTRLSGETFGSAVTFGCMDKSSAPGQIDIRELKKILEILHNK